MATPSPGYAITVRVEDPLPPRGHERPALAAVSTAGGALTSARRGGVPRGPPRRRRHL